MEQEKIKEIKKVLEEGQFNTINHHQKEGKPIKISFADILTLINELESENERLNKSEIGELIKENEGLAKQCLDWSELNFKKRKQVVELKDRIAELEKELKEEKMCSFNRSTIIMLNEKELEHLKVENERLANRITCQVVLPDDKLEEIKKECLEKVELAKGELLKQFAERLIEKKVKLGDRFNIYDIDESLKEFIND